MEIKKTKIVFADNHKFFLDNICEDIVDSVEENIDIDCVYKPKDIKKLAKDESVSIIFLDISFNTDPIGIKLCKEIKKSRKNNIRVNMLSQYFSNKLFFKSSIMAGCDEYFEKFDDVDYTSDMIAAVIGFYNFSNFKNWPFEEISKNLCSKIDNARDVIETLMNEKNFFMIYEFSKVVLTAFENASKALAEKLFKERANLMLHYGFWELLRDSAWRNLLINDSDFAQLYIQHREL
jgi:hypothetical protein